jgi:hypothetical protein
MAKKTKGHRFCQVSALKLALWAGGGAGGDVLRQLTPYTRLSILTSREFSLILVHALTCHEGTQEKWRYNSTEGVIKGF